MMLQKMNTGASAKVTKVLLGGVMFSALLGLVLTDVGGFFRDGAVGGHDVAKIGSKSISASEFGKIYQRRLEQSGMTDATARQMGAPNIILQQEVERQTLLQAANKMGIRISNPYVANELKKQLDQINMPGTPGEKLQRVLMQQKITEKELVELLRGDFAINLLGSAISDPAMQIPAPLTNAMYQASKQKRAIDRITITPANIKDKKVLTEEDVTAFFNENKENYRTSEARDIAVLVLPQSLFIKDVAVTPAEAEAYYKEHSDQFMAPERVRMEQIIVQDEKEAQKIVDAKPTSLESYKGKDIQRLKNDWYTKSGLPKEFDEALYPAQPKGLVGPVKSALGWHVIVVESYQDATPLAFADVKDKATLMVKDEKLDTQLSEFTNELDAMVANDASLESIAEKYKLKIKTVSNLQSATVQQQLETLNVPKVTEQRVQDAAFTLESGEISPLLDISNGDYALVQVTKLNPSVVPEMKTVVAQVRKDAEKSQQNKSLVALAESLLGKYDVKNPGEFDKAVKAAGLNVQAVAPAVKEILERETDVQTAQMVFNTLTPENAVSYTQGEGKITLVRLTDVVSSNEKPDAKTAAQISESLHNSMAQEIQLQFMQAWEQKLKVRVNQALMQSLFNPQAAEQ